MEMARLLFTLNANVAAVIDCNYFEYVESWSCSSAYLVPMLHSAYYTTRSQSLKAEHKHEPTDTLKKD